MQNNVISPWNEENIAELRRLWGYGYSCAQIGAAIGMTRNAVIGKAHRLKLASRAGGLNINAQRRAVDPYPAGTNRSSKPRTTKTVFKSREIKPKREVAISTAPRRIQVVSVHTGQFLYKKRLPHLPEMSKSELRAMLATALQNTAAMESQA